MEELDDDDEYSEEEDEEGEEDEDEDDTAAAAGDIMTDSEKAWMFAGVCPKAWNCVREAGKTSQGPG